MFYLGTIREKILHLPLFSTISSARYIIQQSLAEMDEGKEIS